MHARLRPQIRRHAAGRPGRPHSRNGLHATSSTRSTCAAGTTAGATPSTASAIPNKPILYSESASALSARAASTSCRCRRPAPISPSKLQVDSYDFNSARWSDIADVEFDLMERDKFVAGEFVWTGFDYLGEPTPFDRQAVQLVLRHRRPVRHSEGPLSICIAATGGRTRRPSTSCRIGTGPTASARTCRCSSTPTATARSCSSTASRSAGGRRSPNYAPPTNVAVGKPATASSVGRPPRPASSRPTRPTTATAARAGPRPAASKNEWWQVDLGSVAADRRRGRSASSGQPGDYQYRIDVSDDGTNWRTVVDHDEWHEGWGNQLTHGINTDAPLRARRRSPTCGTAPGPPCARLASIRSRTTRSSTSIGCGGWTSPTSRAS